MINEVELEVIGEELTKLLGQGVDMGKISLLRRLVDDYKTLVHDRDVIKQDISGLVAHLASQAHPHRCPDCLHITNRIQVRANKR